MKKPDGNIKLNRRLQSFEFRKESFEIMYHVWIDEDDGEEFTTDELDELNITQVHNQYRSKYGIPFVEEIKAIRNQYDLSASKMSEILGLGPNAYRNYENGEMPSVNTGRLIQLAKDPEKFKNLIELSQNEFEPKDLGKINQKVHASLTGADPVDARSDEKLFGIRHPDIYNGYLSPNIDKVAAMVRFFAWQLKPFKTKMNKLLFYADFLHYSRAGYSISGLTYIAIAHGPVPRNYASIYERLVDMGYVDIEEVEFDDFGGEKLSLDEKEELIFFTDTEIQALQDICKSLGKLNTSQIVNASHDEMAWKQNVDEHGRIRYDFGFSLTYSGFQL